MLIFRIYFVVAANVHHVTSFEALQITARYRVLSFFFVGYSGCLNILEEQVWEYHVSIATA